MKSVVFLSFSLIVTQITAYKVPRLYSSLNPIDRRQTTNSTCENTATSRNCWGNYSIDTNYYDVTPDTGVTREVKIFLQLIRVYP